MNEEVETYLNKIHAHLHLDPNTEKVIIKEIYDHLAEKVVDEQRGEKACQHAIHTAIEDFGSPGEVARLMYEAHSQKNWHEVILCGEAHLFVSFLFMFHLWQNPFVLGLMLIISSGITWYGLKKGISEWAYSWCGYLIAVLGIGIYVTRHIASRIILHFFKFPVFDMAKFNVVPAYIIPFVVVFLFLFFLVFAMVRKVLRQDWISVSYMLMPVPFLSIWLNFIDKQSVFSGWSSAQLTSLDTRMALCFMILAGASIFFVRIRLRFYKFLYLAAASTVSSLIIARSVWANISLISIALICVFALMFLLIPAVLYRFSFHKLYMDSKWLKNLVKDSTPLRCQI